MKIRMNRSEMGVGVNTRVGEIPEPLSSVYNRVQWGKLSAGSKAWLVLSLEMAWKKEITYHDTEVVDALCDRTGMDKDNVYLSYRLVIPEGSRNRETVALLSPGILYEAGHDWDATLMLRDNLEYITAGAPGESFDWLFPEVDEWGVPVDSDAID